MKLTFSNIGRFVEETDVEINGITVIAGINGTGKSTISKILYCIFDSLYGTDMQIENNRIASIERTISRPIRQMERLNSMHEIAKELCTRRMEIVTYENVIAILAECEYPLHQIDEVDTKELVEQILDVLDIGDGEILEQLVMARFFTEFKHDLKHVNYKNAHSEIELKVRDKFVNITFDDGMFSEGSACHNLNVFVNALTKFWLDNLARGVKPNIFTNCLIPT